MRLNELNERLLRIQREHGDIPVLLSVEHQVDESGLELVHGEIITGGVDTEQDHKTEGLFVRISGSDREE